jgi:hypothetical protein
MCQLNIVFLYPNKLSALCCGPHGGWLHRVCVNTLEPFAIIVAIIFVAIFVGDIP